MSFTGRIQCDRCERSVDAPPDGSYPQNWGAVSFKISRPRVTNAMEQFKDRRKWLHICDECAPDFYKFMGLDLQTQNRVTRKFSKVDKVETGE